MRVIVHGGAGSDPDDPAERQAVLDDAAAAGRDADTPLDAVEAATRVLESPPRFNAGVGGAVQSDGTVRTDAGVMTSDRDAGAVCSMPGVEHAVSAARVVAEDTPHVLVSGDHAVDLAADFGVETDVDLWTEKSREKWGEHDPPEGSPREQLAWLREKFGENAAQHAADHSSGERETPEESRDGKRRSREQRDPRDHDTVGAVAGDGESVAAATSTGGRWFALAGRVGDVPQVGSGFYASPAGGASATGAGEDIAKVTLSRRAVRYLEDGNDAQAAADRAIEEFGELTGSNAGVIVLDADGDVGSAFNSDAMQTAVSE